MLQVTTSHAKSAYTYMKWKPTNYPFLKILIKIIEASLFQLVVNTNLKPKTESLVLKKSNKFQSCI